MPMAPSPYPRRCAPTWAVLPRSILDRPTDTDARLDSNGAGAVFSLAGAFPGTGTHGHHAWRIIRAMRLVNGHYRTERHAKRAGHQFRLVAGFLQRDHQSFINGRVAVRQFIADSVHGVDVSGGQGIEQ